MSETIRPNPDIKNLQKVTENKIHSPKLDESRQLEKGIPGELLALIRQRKERSPLRRELFSDQEKKILIEFVLASPEVIINTNWPTKHHVFKLNRKLKELGIKVKIVHERDLGYRLVVDNNLEDRVAFCIQQSEILTLVQKGIPYEIIQWCFSYSNSHSLHLPYYPRKLMLSLMMAYPYILEIDDPTLFSGVEKHLYQLRIHLERYLGDFQIQIESVYSVGLQLNIMSKHVEANEKSGIRKQLIISDETHSLLLKKIPQEVIDYCFSGDENSNYKLSQRNSNILANLMLDSRFITATVVETSGMLHEALEIRSLLKKYKGSGKIALYTARDIGYQFFIDHPEIDYPPPLLLSEENFLQLSSKLVKNYSEETTDTLLSFCFGYTYNGKQRFTGAERQMMHAILVSHPNYASNQKIDIPSNQVSVVAAHIKNKFNAAQNEEISRFTIKKIKKKGYVIRIDRTRLD